MVIFRSPWFGGGRHRIGGAGCRGAALSGSARGDQPPRGLVVDWTELVSWVGCYRTSRAEIRWVRARSEASPRLLLARSERLDSVAAITRSPVGLPHVGVDRSQADTVRLQLSCPHGGKQKRLS
jgi:hypothetical protein